MEPCPQSNRRKTSGKTPFQFGVRSLLVLTAACAVVLSVASSIQAPTAVRLGLVYLGAYFGFVLWAPALALAAVVFFLIRLLLLRPRGEK